MPDHPSSVTEAGRVLSAPGGAFFSNNTPMGAGALRGLTLALGGVVVSGLVTILQSQTGLPSWLPVIWVPMLIQVLRTIEGAIDQSKVV